MLEIALGVFVGLTAFSVLVVSLLHRVARDEETKELQRQAFWAKEWKEKQSFLSDAAPRVRKLVREAPVLFEAWREAEFWVLNSERLMGYKEGSVLTIYELQRRCIEPIEDEQTKGERIAARDAAKEVFLSFAREGKPIMDGVAAHLHCIDGDGDGDGDGDEHDELVCPEGMRFHVRGFSDAYFDYFGGYGDIEDIEEDAMWRIYELNLTEKESV